MAIALVFLVVGVCLGFIMGARARVVTVARNIIRGLNFNLKAAAPDESPKAIGGNTEDDQPEEGDADAEPDPNDIAPFLNTADDPTLDDHPEMYMSPIIMYHVKKSKERQRAQQRIDFLAAEGLDEDQIREQLLMDESTGGGGQSAGRSNPLAILIAVGARVEAARGAQNQDAVERQERRRQARTVAVYLNKSLDIEVKKTELKRRSTKGTELKTPVQVANELKDDPKANGVVFRETRNVSAAKGARNVFREWHRTRKPEDINRFVSESDSDEEGGTKEEEQAMKRQRGGGMAMDINALAALQEEFAGEFEFGGEDGDDDDNAQLAA